MGKGEFEDHAAVKTGGTVGSGEEPKSFKESIRAVKGIDESIAAAKKRLAALTDQRDSVVMDVLREVVADAEDLDRRLKTLEDIGNAAVNASVSQIRAKLGIPTPDLNKVDVNEDEKKYNIQAQNKQ